MSSSNYELCSKKILISQPTNISDELAVFLGESKGTKMSRANVSRRINEYISDNRLQDKENIRKINPDSKLAALLNINENGELTYFNIQKYMLPHFPELSTV